jgi:hypothetical protein
LKSNPRQPLSDNFQHISKSTENRFQTHDWRRAGGRVQCFVKIAAAPFLRIMWELGVAARTRAE